MRAALLLAACAATNNEGVSYEARIVLRDRVRDMHAHALQSYMDHGYPHDELLPLSCEGRRWDARKRGTLDDSLGGYMMTLVDGVDTQLVVGDHEAFARSLDIITSEVSFDRDVSVSTFEATIRVLGGLLSAHYLVTEPVLRPAILRAAANSTLDASPVDTRRRWARELKGLAADLGARLLPAFRTPTGIPAHRVNLRRGLLSDESRETCAAAAGTMLLEFARLSRLTGDRRYAQKAREAVDALWRRRSARTDLVGSTICAKTGRWLSPGTGIGAGVDSFYEYLVKAALYEDDPVLLERGLAGVAAAHQTTAVRDASNNLTWNLDVRRDDGRRISSRVSSLAAFWPSLLLLAGSDVGEAQMTFRGYWEIFRRFGALPELFDLDSETAVHFGKDAPLRPELAESALHLYLRTNDGHYLVVGRELINALNDDSRVACGFAAVADVDSKRLDDRMDSYFFAETLKYLFLLFDLSLEPQDRQSFFCCDERSVDRLNSTRGCAVDGRPCLSLSATLLSTEGHFFQMPAGAVSGAFGARMPADAVAGPFECEASTTTTTSRAA